jgi:RHS repeat-associated protein
MVFGTTPAPRNKSPPVASTEPHGARLAARILALLACLAPWVAAVPQAGASPPAESPLVVPGVQALDGGQQVLNQRQARLSSVEAVQAREASQTEYEGLDGEEAERVAGEAFPEVVKDPGGGPPQLPAGQSIVGYPSADAAQVDLGGGRHAVIASSAPMSTLDSAGQRVPIDLGLGEVGDAFEPRTPAVGVRIPKQLSSGVQLPGVGVSLMPLDGEGPPVGGSEGVVDGATAFFADTGLDVGTLVKPVAEGFDLATLLYSQRSPERLSFRVGMPAGASLVQRQDGSVEVVEEGATLALIDAPSAQDAEGTMVPVSQSVSGDILTVVVDSSSGAYRMPIAVDPTVIETGGYLEKILLKEEFRPGTWGFTTDAPESFYATRYNEGVEDYDLNSKEFTTGQWGFFSYGTQGESRIYQVTAYTYLTNIGKEMEDTLGIENVHSGTPEASHKWIGEYFEETTICALAECATGTVTHGTNDQTEVFYKQNARENGLSFNSYMTSAEVYILQEAAPTVSFDTTEERSKGGWLNGLYPGRWVPLSYGPAAFINMHDPGVGISELGLKAPEVPGWGRSLSGFPESGCTGVQCDECHEIACGSQPIIEPLEGLPEGEDVIEATVKDPVGLTATAKGIVKVDNAKPYDIKLSGLPPGNEIGYGHYHLTATATDGSGKTPSSGVASITLAVDGEEVGKPSGSCTPGPCKATGEWTLNGEEYIAGKHTLTVTATDGAGNVAKEEYPLSIHSAESVSAGPGSVELATGALTLGVADVSIASPGGSLSVQRSYDSRNPTLGEEGPFGPQWSGLSLGGSESLKELANGSIVLTAAGGQQSLFPLEGGKYVSPTGDKNLTLSEELPGVFALKDQSGSVTTFTIPAGGSGNILTPSRREEDDGTHSTTYSFQTVEGVTEPTEALAPVAPGVKCGTLVIGCRALTFEYAKGTTATGEAPSDWGEYKGRLTGIYFTGWDPSKKEMTVTMVAEYSYDGQGRLRAEWDPRISPALKTTYGYDPEGHVTSVTSPGQQPWTFTYGTAAGDANTGRLLAVTRPSASTAAGSGEVPKYSEVPRLSTSNPTEGVELKVGTGAWSGSPLNYSYQWESCNSAGKECAPILGATNPGYTPPYKEEEHTLLAQVTATNAAGSNTVATSVSSAVPLVEFPPTYSLQFGEDGSGKGQLKAPLYATVSGGTVYVADPGNNRIDEFNAETGAAEYSFGSEGDSDYKFKDPVAVAVNNHEEIFVADAGNKRIVVYSPSEKFITERVLPGAPAGMVIAEEDIFYIVNSSTNEVEEYEYYNEQFSRRRTFGGAGSGEGQLKAAKDVAYSYRNKMVYVTDAGNNRVDEYQIKYTEGKFYKMIGMKAGSRNGEFKEPTGIAVDEDNNLWVVDTGNNRVEEFTPEGKYYLKSGTTGVKEGQFTKPTGIALTYSGTPFIVDSGNDRVQKFKITERPSDPPVAPATPPKPGTSAVSTFEYQVPVSGTGAPYALGSTETAAWAQTDDPVEGTAIYPPDEPMGWPAQDYRRASIYYLDDRDRTVNVAAPSGGISTTEYNATNDVTRTLTPDNRQAALAEGAKSAEVAQLLDTHSTYNSEGTEVEETVGPQHTVKLKDGSEGLARHRTRYFYDEGAPKTGGPYDLVTKSTEGAQLAKGSEEDVRTTATEYGGQSNLGWKLRSPTAIVTDPGGLKITTRTTYEPSTGNELETGMPASAVKAALEVYSSKFGSLGNKEDHFEAPWGLAVEQTKGYVYVSDYDANHIVKLSSSGSYVAMVASKGSGEGQVKDPEALAVTKAGDLYVGDSGNHRVQEFSASGKYLSSFGKEGSGEGQFSSTIGGLAVDSSGNVWVSDSSDDRVEEFNSQGKYVRAFGKEGSGEGQLNVPLGLTIYGGDLYVADFDNNRVQEFNLEGKYLGQFSSYGAESGQLKEPWAITADAEGDLYVSDRGPDRVEEFSSTGKFLAWLGAYGSGEGQFDDPEGIATNSSGDLYIVDSGNYRVQKWMPGNQGAHTTQTVYYTAESKSPVPACENHPEWANLPCQTQPAAQPETPGLPNLPVTSVTYNIWDEPETTTETVGASTRTTTIGYDEAGRPLTTSVKSSTGVPAPPVTDKYSEETGALVEQSTSEGKAQALTSVYNTLGQLVSSTDADGNEATISYDIDGRQEKLSDGKGAQAFGYDPTTGEQTKVTDSAAGSFTATYDVQGLMTGESYPNGLKANYTYNSTGQPIGLEYIKASNCGTSCTWYSDHVTPSISGQWTNQTTSFSTQSYSYDAAGRLVQTQETPTGQDCVTRNYTYDTDTNRTSATKIIGSKSGCAAEGGTSEPNSYDTADRLTDTGTVYENFGNITKLAAYDAGGAELTSTYYATNKLASQTQGGETIAYYLDPAGRVRETVAAGNTNSTVISHYAGGGSTPAWTIEPSTGDWTRNIGCFGSLAAIQTNGGSPVLQLPNLHGDIIATASHSEAESKLLSSTEATEYGVPSASNPPKYSWLGASGAPTEFSTGVLATGARSYIPQLGRFLQTDPVPGGSANAYAYTRGDPVNSSDPSGAYSYGGPSAALIHTVEQLASEAAAEQAAINAAAAAAAAAKAAAANSAAALNNPAGPEGNQIPGNPALFWDEYGVLTGQLPSGTDPYLGHGIWVAFNLHWWGLEVQFHFNKEDSLYIAALGPAGAAAWVLATFTDIQPVYAAAVAVAFGAAAIYSVKKVEENNCIGVGIDNGVPVPGLYRSKKECG